MDLDTPISVVIQKKELLDGWVGQIVTGAVVAVGVLGIQEILWREWNCRVLQCLVIMSVQCCFFPCGISSFSYGTYLT